MEDKYRIKDQYEWETACNTIASMSVDALTRGLPCDVFISNLRMYADLMERNIEEVKEEVATL
jgi:hypothetical protein